LTFEIQTHPFKWKVIRNHNDFVALRDYLLKMYPQTLVPSLPLWDARKAKLTQRQLVHKCSYYQRFLTCIMKSQVLRSAELLVEFLREADVEQFHAKVVNARVNKGPQKLDEIQTLTGGIQVSAPPKAKSLCFKLENYIQTYEDITKFLKKKASSIEQKSADLADEYYSMATELQRFSTLLGITEIPQITQLYKKFSECLVKNGDSVLQTGKLVNVQLNSWFKYHADETLAYRDQKALVDQSFAKYEEALKELLAKKQNLFRRGDVKLWRVEEDRMAEALNARDDFAAAQGLMLPQESQEVQAKKEEWEFFANQCYKELRRVTMLNYNMAREIFVNVGEMVTMTLGQLQEKWADFLKYYTGLNEERKRDEWTFQMDRGLLEEHED